MHRQHTTTCKCSLYKLFFLCYSTCLPLQSNARLLHQCLPHNINIFCHSSGTLTVLALGPLTNIALAIKMDATFLTNIHALVIMGGAETRGNVTPTAEYNFYCDPEAAHIVFQHCCAATATAKAAGEGKGKGEGKGEGHVNANMHGNVLKSVHNKPRVTLVSWECTERHALSWEWVEAWYTKVRVGVSTVIRCASCYICNICLCIGSFLGCAYLG